MTDQAEQAVDSVHDRMMAILENEPEEVIEEEADSEAEDTEETTEESETQEPEEEATEEIIWNGETKALTKTELKNLAQQGYDYTQKSQTLAEERRAFEARAQAAQQQYAVQSQLLDHASELKMLDAQLAQYQGVNWSELAQENPAQYLQINQTYRDLKDAREAKLREYGQKAQEIQHVQTQSVHEMIAREAQRLSERIPAFKGEKAQQTKEEVKTYLSKEGFNTNEITSIGDHRIVSVAYKAMLYDKLMANKPQVTKRMAEAPPVVKGKKSPPKNQEAEDLKAKLKKTGRGEYAAKLIEGML
jgi:hypothetical protein